MAAVVCSSDWRTVVGIQNGRRCFEFGNEERVFNRPQRARGTNVVDLEPKRFTIRRRTEIKMAATASIMLRFLTYTEKKNKMAMLLVTLGKKK